MQFETTHITTYTELYDISEICFNILEKVSESYNIFSCMNSPPPILQKDVFYVKNRRLPT